MYDTVYFLVISLDLIPGFEPKHETDQKNKHNQNVRNKFHPRILLRILLTIERLFHHNFPPSLIYLKQDTTLIWGKWYAQTRQFRRWDGIHGKKCHNMDGGFVDCKVKIDQGLANIL